MSTNLKLLLAAPVAILLGVLLFFLTDSSTGPEEQAVPTVEEVDDVPEMVDLRDPGEDSELAQDFLEDRWGHLGDVGRVSPVVDPAGDVYFVEPRIYRARVRGKIHYFRGISKPQKLGKTVRASDVAGVVNSPDLKGAVIKPTNMSLSARMLPPIEDPMDMPPNLRDEHPLSPNYKGPKGSN